LTWLHPDAEEAARKYVKIRSGLIKKFASHDCSLPDQLADITMDRVAEKLPGIIDTYKGEREPYFHRVAYYVLLEHFASNPGEVELKEDLPLPTPDKDDNIEPEFDCLDKCIESLAPQKRYVIENYYYGSKGVKIRRRKELALSLKVDLPALRVLALRIRRDLRTCIIDCLQKRDRLTRHV